MNNKGFAITTILYGILILFMFLLVSMLGILATYKKNLELLVDSTNGARDIIMRDDTPPTLSISISTPLPLALGVTATANDESGIAMYYYKIDSGSYISSTSNTHLFNSLTAGVHTISVYVVDTTGNQSEVKTATGTVSNPAVSNLCAACGAACRACGAGNINACSGCANCSAIC